MKFIRVFDDEGKVHLINIDYVVYIEEIGGDVLITMADEKRIRLEKHDIDSIFDAISGSIVYAEPIK